MLQPADPEFPWGVAWGVLTAAGALALSYLHLWLTERNRKLYAPLKPLYDDRGNACWATREDVNKLGTKVNALHDEVTRVEDKADKNEHEIGLIRQAQMFTHQEMMDKLAETVATLKGVVTKMEEVTGNQRAQAEQLRIILNRRDGT
jgi:predicted DNA-binding protein YlxM (UPF0122 family)